MLGRGPSDWVPLLGLFTLLLCTFRKVEQLSGVGVATMVGVQHRQGEQQHNPCERVVPIEIPSCLGTAIPPAAHSFQVEAGWELELRRSLDVSV